MENQSQKRLIAHKLQIKHLLQGTYHQQAGWNPNYLLTQNQKVSRVNLIAVIVAQNQDQTLNLVLDDGTGQINLRIFDPLKSEHPQIGDTVLVVAKIRQFNNELYLVPEIIKKIKNPKWIEVRKLELQDKTPSTPPQPEPEPEQPSLAPYEYVLSLVKKIDQGQGADVDDIIKQSTLDSTEQLIEELLKEGDIFEISPGRVKILK
ncbi:hypothetical protein KY306_01955 [Candidatus Woesearchaeota archaeon]|nr:hypothetical protein [Candidatus Woesearchaeota archaeon]